MRHVVAFALSLLGIVGMQMAAAAQQPPDSSQKIWLNVVVTNKSGKPVQGLAQSDFVVMDDRHPSPIVAFHAPEASAPETVDASTEVILILDEVNATFDQVNFGRDGIVKFLTENHGNLTHPTTLGFFAESGLQLQTQPSVDGNAMAAAIQQQAQGLRILGRAEQERLKRSQDAIDDLIARERNKPGRKLVVWVSPGWPLLSQRRDDLIPKQQQEVFNSVVKLNTELRLAQITLYSADPLRGGGGGERTVFYQNFTKGLAKPNGAEFGDLGLQVLAEQTGGRAIFGSDAMAKMIDECVQEIEGTYSLAIMPAPGEGKVQFHGVEVRVEKQGLKVRSRDGYYTFP